MADVLVVGAGPTGLALAADLAQSGVSARVIDKASAPSDKSKALGVQAGTLEVLGRVFGQKLPDAMVAAGQPAREAFIHVDDLAPIRADLSTIPSRFDFILILPQSETERILGERLSSHGGAVERNRELIGLRETGSGFVATIQRAGASPEEAPFKFVVGCDGAQSATRRLLDIPFAGAAYTGEFLLADATLRWPWSYGCARPFINSEGIMAFFPFKDERHYRVIVVKGMKPSPIEEVALPELQECVRRLSDGAIQIESASWLTRFHVHHRMAGRFRKGNGFLAGDAAHIHSPAGGQGMNTGIQDALNLGAKLAAVLRGAPPASLDDYEKERMPVARSVLRGTDLAFKLALLPENALIRFGRRYLFPRLLRSPFLQRRVIRAISEVDVARKESARRDAAAKTPASS